MPSSQTFCRVLFVVGLLSVTLYLLGPAAIQAQTPDRWRIESDNSRVNQTGTWTSQSTAAASGGAYLHSSGAEADVLTFEFEGSAIEIIYIAAPQLGTLAIEVDGTVLRTVITTADTTQYAQSAKFSYLSNEPHTLKVYAQEGGIVAIDAFVVSNPVPAETVAVADDEIGDGGIQSSTCLPVSVIHRVSLTHTGGQANNVSIFASISGDGRYVAFYTRATLALGDADSEFDSYVYDRQNCTVQLVSVSSAGVKGNCCNETTLISANGRYVAISSFATNLVAGDTNAARDVFVHDRQTGTTTRVSVATGGAQGNGEAGVGAISADGRYVAFYSTGTNLVTGDTNGQADVFVHDRQTGTTTRVSLVTGGGQATGGGSFPEGISSDGRFITFQSAATNLVAGDTNAFVDVFVHDRQTGTTTRVSVATGGAQGTGANSYNASMSADGRYVAFQSAATNLVAGDTNGFEDVFVHDRQTGTTTRVSIGTGGVQSTGGGSDSPEISGDGRYVAFQSTTPNLVAGDTNTSEDVFVHDRASGITRRVSLASDGTQANGRSFGPDISQDGQYISFRSPATNLVPGDTNGHDDMFVTSTSQPPTDKLALFQTSLNGVNLLNTLQDNPPYTAYTYLSAYAPINGGLWVMGDWNGDGLKTPGIYANGPFYYTNKASESGPNDWRSLWIGIAGPPVAGRFNGSLANDCIGAIQTSASGGQTVFVLYFTCDLSGAPVPTISSQWLSAVLPDSGGFSGAYQFGAGDFDGNAVDSIAVRRGPFIAFGNVAPTTGPAQFNFAQFIGAPITTDVGIFVVGNWDADIFDSFGLFYQNGEFFYRNDLLFNSGAYGNQTIAPPFAGTMQAATWR